MKNKLILMLTLAFLTLSSCKNKEDIPTSIQFTTERNLPIMTGKLNGITAKFLIDSGAESSIIDSYLIFKYNFTLTPDNLMVGVGGLSQSYKVEGAYLFYDGHPMGIEFKSVDMRLFRKGTGAVGVIGSDYLIKHNLIIDYKNNVLRKSNILD